MTPQEIQQVQTNLARMQAFNDYIYTSGNSYIINCFALLSQQDCNDPGNLVGMALMEGSIGAIFSCMGPVGAFSSCFLCSIISTWADAVPPNLADTFSSMIIRFDKSHVQLDQDIARYAADPQAYWNQTFTWNGITITLGDLATIDFPSETNPDFYTLAALSLKGLDQSTWHETLKIQCKISQLAPYNDCECTVVSKKTNIDQWYASLLAAKPAYFATWTWHSDTGLYDHDEWHVNEFCLNFQTGNSEHLQVIPDGAAHYLFIDSSPGNIINSSGLFTRNWVFDRWQGMNLDFCILRTAT
jgi:hypothetical protein